MTISVSEAHATVAAANLAGKQVRVTIAGDDGYFTGTARFLPVNASHLILFGVLVPLWYRNAMTRGEGEPAWQPMPDWDGDGSWNVASSGEAKAMHLSTDQLLTLTQSPFDADLTLGKRKTPYGGLEPDPDWQLGDGIAG